MSTPADLQARLTFFLTGRASAELGPAIGLRPALMAGYRDLAALRHDYPVLLQQPAPADGAPALRPLRELVDAALATLARGADAERTRRQVLRIEQAVRVLLAEGREGHLGALWTEAAQILATERDASFADTARRARAAMAVDGPLLGCDAATAVKLTRHVWLQVQRRKAQAFEARVTRLIQRLSDILRADFEHSAAGRSATQLKASVGGGDAEAFDFDAMSRLLTRAVPRETMPEARRERVRRLLAVLDAQPFFALPDAEAAHKAGSEVFHYEFDSCEAALLAWRERQPRLVELARAIAIAELEIDGTYQPARHDALFESFGANGLEPQELARFPDYLVCLNGGALSAAEQARLMEIFASELPIKLLYRIDDLLEAPHGGEGAFGPGVRGRQIAHMAMGLNQVYVLQAPASHLVHCRQRLHDGMAFNGPALISVFSGLHGGAPGQAPYLTAAAAMESRAFPAFVYDPAAGPDWAARFSLEGNPQPELDWPIHHFEYEDTQHQRVSAELAFSIVDYLAADPRFAQHFACLPAAADEQGLTALDAALARPPTGLPEQVPCLRMVDAEDRLHRVIVDARLLREARRWREMWHSLQELGGVHNSHAQRLLARERAAWEARHAREAEAIVVVPVATAAVATPSSEAAAPAEPDLPERSPDEAYIETARCSTCNECTQINPKMFAYNADKQAYIADLNAGTYAQLVEAAESCQVSVIHPGKPRNPNEPGLEALIERAQPFL
ncbi:MAG: ferredoxin [Burkholderiales bacterium]|nr:ferredoxin [Burkholderiales bacterium]